MTTALQIVLALPICVATICFLFLDVRKIKPVWLILAVGYAIAYFAALHFYFKVM